MNYTITSYLAIIYISKDNRRLKGGNYMNKLD